MTSLLKFLIYFGYFVVFLLFGLILFYFWQSDFSAWDMPGHLFASFFYQQYLWPSFSGWNHLAFGGYPQGYFYPALFHWLVGGLAKLINLGIAFKLVLSLSIILLPISFYFFLKSLNFKSLDRILAILWLFIFLNIVKFDIGGDFYSTFAIGLVTAQFALPFYFFYLTFLKEGVENFKKLIISSLFLAILILSHAFFALAGLISSIVYFFLFYFKRAYWKYYFFHLTISFLLVSFWLFPLFYFSSFKTGVFVEKSIPIHPLYLIFFFLALVVAAKKENILLKPILCLFISILFFLIIHQYISFQKILPEAPLHLYRFLIFIYLFLAIIISQIFVSLNIRKIGLILSILILLLSFYFLKEEVFAFQKRRIFLPVYNLEDSLGLVPSEFYGRDILFLRKTPHVLSHSLLLQKNRLLNGLFVESALNSQAIQSLIHEVYPFPFTWGVNFYQPNPELIKDHLRYLGVCWILSFEKLNHLEQKPKEIKAKIEINSQKTEIPLYLYRLFCNIAEIIDLPKIETKENWSEKINLWWQDKEKIKRVIIQKKDSEPEIFKDYSFEPEAKVYLTKMKPPDYYQFEVLAEKEQFVFLKIPYFPNWKAYQNGKEIEIFRASPNSMVIKAKGKIELKFKKNWLEIVSYYISLASLILVIFFLIFSKAKSEKIWNLLKIIPS
jgi:hypothetical protein